MKYYFSVALILFTFKVSPAQNLPRRAVTDLQLGGKVIINTYKQPFKWKKKQWLLFGGTLATAAALSFTDEPIHDFLQDNRSGFQTDLARVGDFMGQPEHNYPVMIAMWGLGVTLNNNWMRDTGIMLFGSVTTSGLLQTFLKTAVGRSRPANGNHDSFRPFSGSGYHSFPSGHTMLALATSYILAKQVNPLGLKIVFYAVPVVVGWSRLYDGAHWFSDIFLGSALGIACAEAVYRLYNQYKTDGQQKLTFGVTPSGIGLSYKL